MTISSKTLLKLNSPDGDNVREISSALPRPCIPGEIPVIDLSDLHSENVDDLEQIAHQVETAAKNSGVFYIKNHGVAPQIIEEARLKSLEYEYLRLYMAIQNAKTNEIG